MPLTARAGKYGKSVALQAGVRKIKEKAGPLGKPRPPKLVLRGQGDALPDPRVPVPAGVTSVTVQVIHDTVATCLESRFDAPFKKNAQNGAGTSAKFKATR